MVHTMKEKKFRGGGINRLHTISQANEKLKRTAANGVWSHMAGRATMARSESSRKEEKSCSFGGRAIKYAQILIIRLHERARLVTILGCLR
jgi:hypothetical protein